MGDICTRITSALLLSILCAIPANAQKRLNVVTTLPDLKSIAEMIGGDHVDVFSIATGYQNPHFVDPKPSYILRLSRADMFVTVGLDLELGWVPALVNSARNSDIMRGGKGYVDASQGVPLLQVPTSVSREQGDIHIYGNPHYWLHPALGKYIAQNIYNRLVALLPEAREDFDRNLQHFNEELDRRMEGWSRAMALFRGARIIAYHNQWPYFENAFGLEIVDFLEPKPGIPPTPSQLAKIIRPHSGSPLEHSLSVERPCMDNVEFALFHFGQRGRQIHDFYVEQIFFFIRRIRVHSSHDPDVSFTPCRLHHPDRTGTLSHQMHGRAAEEAIL
ncbi:MAG: zinc ABC transporter substrate-binding protein [Bacteroidetes bacterium]|nr:zinc ABC transporter substrate-binding protein [Bacteroidota bacterium]